MEKVQVKIRQGIWHVALSEDHFMDEWNKWREKLRLLSDKMGKPEVFFHFPALNSQILLDCLKEIAPYCIIQGYCTDALSLDTFEIVMERLRGGNQVVFSQGALVVGDIGRDVSVILKSGNLYVMGTIYGRVECQSEKSVLICNKMVDARIGFYGKWHISTKKDGPVLYDKEVWKSEGERKVWQEQF